MRCAPQRVPERAGRGYQRADDGRPALGKDPVLRPSHARAGPLDGAERAREPSAAAVP